MTPASILRRESLVMDFVTSFFSSVLCSAVDIVRQLRKQDEKSSLTSPFPPPAALRRAPDLPSTLNLRQVAPASTAAGEPLAQRLDRKRKAVSRMQEEENQEYQKALVRLRDFKTTAQRKVGEAYDALEVSLKNVHENVKSRIDRAKYELDGTAVRKGAALSEVAKVVSAERERGAMPCYSQYLSDAVAELQRVVQQCFKPPFVDAEQFLLALRRDDASSVAEEEIIANDSEPLLVKRAKTATEDTADRCAVCSTLLKPNNFLSLPDHKQCAACMDCIRARRRLRVSCPVCKKLYSKESKSALEKIASGVESTPQNQHCDKCSCDLTDKKAHKCAGEETRCLDCQQRLVARSCFRKKRITCPECKKDCPEVNYQHPLCSVCFRELLLNEVAHWCDGGHYLVCAHCEPECRCCD